MTAAVVEADETTVPLLPCLAPDETPESGGAVGFTVTRQQRRPYLYRPSGSADSSPTRNFSHRGCPDPTGRAGVPRVSRRKAALRPLTPRPVPGARRGPG
ncbi:hypothetical protein FHX34_102842 [Actinoplanes teichomyceticus]|uniref:Uncharacterized protein n=1 Tax=Actinoplanes teichomyceticus TaxID=1867 RepID=A0A561WK95_ACTTI|nr:hypothetical protein FHX34_102842 [Actinoplanes teichomyceticus]